MRNAHEFGIDVEKRRRYSKLYVLDECENIVSHDRIDGKNIKNLHNNKKGVNRGKYVFSCLLRSNKSISLQIPRTFWIDLSALDSMLIVGNETFIFHVQKSRTKHPRKYQREILITTTCIDS